MANTHTDWGGIVSFVPLYRKVVSVFIVFGLLVSALATASQNQKPVAELPKPFEILQLHEAKSNAVAERSTKPIAIEHFEIPLRIVEVDVAKRIPKEILSSLIFEKNGEKYLRWIINPEDTKWHREVAQYLRSKGIPVIKGQYFTAYQTASRSYLVVDPKTGATFSVKVSTNNTGGHWTDKKQTWEDARQVRWAYEYVHDQIRRRGGLKHGILIDEPAAFGLPAIDQGMLVRTYSVLEKGRSFLLPGFAVLHDAVGRNLAFANGSNQPAEYWNEHYNRPLARALAELYAITGMQYDSPHSQNFLVEFDLDGRPTGRIGIRDFGDVYVTAEALEANGRSDLVRNWDTDNLRRGVFDVAIGLLHGNINPSWIDGEIYTRYAYDFFNEFEREFKRVTGIDLGTTRTPMSLQALYFSKRYLTDSEEGQKYLEWLRIRQPGSCRHIFKKAM